MKPFRILSIVAVMALLLAACGQGQPAAQGLLGAIKQRSQLVVGTSADYPPYESVDASGNYVGFDMDLVREIGKRMGVEVKVQDMPFDSLIAAVQEKKIDAVIAAMQATPERQEQVDFTVVYRMPKDSFIVTQDSTIVMNSPKDAAGHTIGVQTGTAQEKWVQENLVTPGLTKSDQVFSYERADIAARDLAAGRIEILYILADAGQSLVDQMGLKVALLTDETIAGGQAIAIPKGETALKAELDRIIGDMEKDGTLKQLLDKAGIP
ncbi:MAG TPA: ABC transporter substrate-binding protein [Anaerolineae bacterium]|nr:ABC transporter substrate-binding protein [Anaerolineae bacterium]